MDKNNLVLFIFLVFPPQVYSHVAACPRESSRGEGRAEPKFSQPVVLRCDKAEPKRSTVLPSNVQVEKNTSDLLSCVYLQLFDWCTILKSADNL